MSCWLNFFYLELGHHAVGLVDERLNSREQILTIHCEERFQHLLVLERNQGDLKLDAVPQLLDTVVVPLKVQFQRGSHLIWCLGPLWFLNA